MLLKFPLKWKISSVRCVFFHLCVVNVKLPKFYRVKSEVTASTASFGNGGCYYNTGGNESASSKSLSRCRLPPVFLVPKTYDLWQSDVTATFWHGLWQLGRNNNNNTRLSCHRTAFLWYRPPPPSPTPCHVLTSRPVVSSFRQRFPPSPRGSDRRDCALTHFFSVSLVLSRNVSTLAHSPYRVLSLLSQTLTLSLLRFLFTLWFLFRRPQTGFTSMNVLVSF